MALPSIPKKPDNIPPVFSKNSTVTTADNTNTVEIKKTEKEIKKVNDKLDKLNSNLDKTVSKLNETIDKLSEKSNDLKDSVDQVSKDLKTQKPKEVKSKQIKKTSSKPEESQSFLERTTGLNAPALGGVGLGAALGTALLPGIGTFIGGTIGGLAANRIATRNNRTKSTNTKEEDQQPNTKLSTPTLGATSDLKTSLDNLTTSINNLSKKIIIPENKSPLSIAGGIEPGSETEKEKDRELLAQAIANKLGDVLQNNAGLGTGGGISIDLPDGGRRTPPGRKPPSAGGSIMEKLGKLFGALDIVGTAGVVARSATVGGAMALPWLGAIAEKKKIEEDPTAKGLEDVPYAKVLRGEAATQGAAGAQNVRKVIKSAGRQELQDVISSKMTDEEVQKEYGKNKQELQNWLNENPNNNRYQIPEKTKSESSVQAQSEQRVESKRVQISNFSEKDFAEKDPENYKKYTEYRDQEYKKAAESLDPSMSRRERQLRAREKATTDAREKFAKEIEAAGAGKVETTRTGNASDSSLPKIQSAEAKSSNAPKVTLDPSKYPNWTQAIKDQIELLQESNYDEQWKTEYIKALQSITPRSDSRMSIEGALRQADAIASKKYNKFGGNKPTVSPTNSAPTSENLDKTEVSESPKVETPTPSDNTIAKNSSSRDRRTLSQTDQLRKVAGEMGLPVDKVEGKFEGGKLTAIYHKGETIDVSDKLSDADRKTVEFARKMRAANENSGRLQAEARDRMGENVSSASTENNDLKQTNAPNITVPVVSTNVNNNNTQQVVPIKAGSRNGSSTAERFLDNRRNF